ncbi:MAG TPA: PBP1A family penicillin-binding protein [Chloroflexota bacterium]|nr:PBP1A family penicillin-binding protein [Chloroflexota bacterium]
MGLAGSVTLAGETIPPAPRVRRRRRWRRVLLCLAAGLLAIPVGIIVLFLIYPLPSNLNPYVPAPSTRIYDRHGRLLYEVVGPGGRRVIEPLSAIPIALRQATIAAEDESFYHNPGIDPGAIVRSLFLDARLGRAAYGGSTITQQLVRTILLTPAEREQRSLTRKLHEASLALQLTLRYSKNQVLAMYLNNVYYGGLAYGVEAASEGYFGRPVADLDLAQCALLAGIPQGPTLYNPLINPDDARIRRQEVLGLLQRDGYITEAQESQADAEPLGLAPPADNILAPHFVFYVLGLLEQQYGQAALEQGGLQITTTLDLNLQQQAEAAVRFHVDQLTKDHLVHDGALVSIDPATGQILAMVGSANYSDRASDGAVNVAVAARQPGSAIKPFTYAAAFSRDYTPATVVDDEPSAFPTKEGIPFEPQNYDLQFHGPVTLRTALANSYNIPAVKVLAHVGIPAMLNMAHAAGITTMNDARRYGLALTLGGGEVRLLDLTDAYGTFATGGVHHDSVAILRVVDSTGKVWQSWRSSSGRRAMSPQVAYLITSILSDNSARMPAFGENSPLLLDRPAAAKTGTTSDFHDNWTVGYTPDLVTGVWVGNADNTAMRDVTGISGAAPIWHDFMESALQNLPISDFPRPQGIVDETICPGTGLPPTSACPDRFAEVFIAGAQPRVPTHPTAPAAVVALGEPATGSQFQINTSVPPAYQQAPVRVQAAGIRPGSLRLLVNGRVAYRFAGMGGEWLWPLSPGTYRLQAVGADPRGHPVWSGVSVVRVHKPQTPL